MAEFPWEGFLIQLREYIHKEPRTEPYIMRHALPKPSTPSLIPDGYQADQLGSNSMTDDFSAQINFAAQAALKRVGVNSQGILSSLDYRIRLTAEQELLIVFRHNSKPTDTRSRILFGLPSRSRRKPYTTKLAKQQQPNPIQGILGLGLGCRVRGDRGVPQRKMH